MENFLTARAQGNLDLAASYLSDQIQFHSANGCTYTGKTEALAFL